MHRHRLHRIRLGTSKKCLTIVVREMSPLLYLWVPLLSFSLWNTCVRTPWVLVRRSTADRS